MNNNQDLLLTPTCELPTGHPLYNVLAPMNSRLTEMSANARTPESITKKEWRKREILRSQGLLA